MLVHSARALIAAIVALCLVHHVQAIQLPAMRRSLASNDEGQVPAAASGASAKKLGRRWFWGGENGSLGRDEDLKILRIPLEMIKTHSRAEVDAWQKWLEALHNKHPKLQKIRWTPNGPEGFEEHGGQDGKAQ